MERDSDKLFPNLIDKAWLSPTGEIADDCRTVETEPLPIDATLGQMVLKLLETPNLGMMSVRTKSDRIIEISRTEPGAVTLTVREIQCP